MPFLRPSLTDLRNQAVQDIVTSGVPGLDGLLRNAVLRILAWVEAGLAYSLYGYLDWIALQAVPFTATDEYLEAWAGLVGIYRKDATGSAGSATFTGQTGTLLPVNTALRRSDGIDFTTTTESTINSAGSVTVSIAALTTGSASNCGAMVPINIVNPVAGINSGGLTGELIGGSDQELNDDLRTRMLVRYRQPPKGGAESDYIDWALAVPGVTRTWVKGNAPAPGSVQVYPMLDDINAATGGYPIGTDGVSTNEPRAAKATGDQLRIADAIWPVQPITALVYVVAPKPHPVNITITALSPGDSNTQANVQASLQDMFLQRAELEGVIWPSDIAEAVLAAPGVVHFTISTPTGPVQAGTGELPVMGTVTFN